RLLLRPEFGVLPYPALLREPPGLAQGNSLRKVPASALTRHQYPALLREPPVPGLAQGTARTRPCSGNRPYLALLREPPCARSRPRHRRTAVGRYLHCPLPWGHLDQARQ